MYEYADKVISYMNRRFIILFAPLKRLASFDEIHVIGNVQRVYKQLDELVRKSLLQIAKKAYADADGTDEDVIDEIWLMDFLNRYDPITKYVFSHEEERKEARLIEALVATKNGSAEVNTALKAWANMVTQFAIEVVDEATAKAYKDAGVDKVRWISVEDARRCPTCAGMHGRTYPVGHVPVKPHIGCRCYTIPV